MQNFWKRGTYNDIVRLTIPNVISNITVPLIGMADVAIASRVGGDVSIGAVTVGTSIFNLVYWNCAFLRMGASGITAQHFGAKRWGECANVLLRSVLIGLVISALLFCFQDALCSLGVRLMSGNSEGVINGAREYVSYRFWAIPASVSLFAITGWFIGMQDAKTPMIIAMLSNVVNIGVSAWLAIYKEMGIGGIALGTVVAQYCGLLASVGIVVARHRGIFLGMTLKTVCNIGELLKLLRVNGDIFVRTLFIAAVFTSFTYYSAQFGEVALAANALQMQLFTLFSYMIDGIAFSAESLIGKHVGSGDRVKLRTTIRDLYICGGFTALLFTLAYVVFGNGILALFDPSTETMEYVTRHIVWAELIPIVGFGAFVADGIMIGASGSRAMRNTVAVAAVVYFVTFNVLQTALGCHALWLALVLFLLTRSVLLSRYVYEIKRQQSGANAR